MALSKITNSGIGAIDTLAVDTDTLVVDSTNNRVGIGITSPSAVLDVKSSGATSTAFRVLRSSTNTNLHAMTEISGHGRLSVYDGSENEDIRLDSNGDSYFNGGSLLAGTTSATAGGVTVRTHIAGSEYGLGISVPASGAQQNIRFVNGTTAVGSVNTNGSSTTYATSSDYRLKENVVADWDATTRLKQLNPVRFNFIADPDKTVDGFLAHEVQDIVPEAISGTKDAMMDEEYEVTPAVLDEDGNVVTPAVMGTRSVPDYQGIDQSKLVPLLVKTIQELEARIVALETA